MRHFGVDFSGASGAPALFVIVDVLKNAQAATWNLGLPGVDTSGARFASDDPSGASLSGRFVAPAAPKFVRGAVTGSDVYFVVFTLQRGAPPEIRVEGEGLTSRVTVGGQTVTFDGERIVWGRGK